MIKVLDHPLVMNDLAILRDKQTSPAEFRAALERIGYHLAIESTKELPVSKSEVATPQERTEVFCYRDELILLPVLRAGLGLHKSFSEIYPPAKTGFFGIKRNEEDFKPDVYYSSLPKINQNTTAIILEVMIATGGTASAALSGLLLEGVSNLILAGVIAAPEGIEKIRAEFPEVKIIVAALDKGLDKNAYIIPGLGDAGDRMFDTEA